MPPDQPAIPKPSRWLRCSNPDCDVLTLRSLAENTASRRHLCSACGREAKPWDVAAEHQDRKRAAAGETVVGA